MNKIWKRTLYWTTGILLVAVLVLLCVYWASQTVPDYYKRAIEIPRARQLSSATELEEMIDLVKDDLKGADEVTIELTQDQINGWLTTRLGSQGRMKLPNDVELPQIVLQPDSVILAFKINKENFSCVVSIRMNVNLSTDMQQLEFQIKEIHAGSLPVAIKRVFDELESAMERSSIQFSWVPGSDRREAVVDIPPDLLKDVEGPISKRVITAESLEIRFERLKVSATVDN